MIPKWERVPENLRNEKSKEYYDMLCRKKTTLAAKRLFDIALSCILIVLFVPVFLVIGLLVKFDSKGKVFYAQERVTQYGRHFRVLKFRTMVENAELMGEAITSHADSRITKVGNVLRRYRLDELPQVFNILLGDMTFVGTRPEVPEYVEKYSEEMKATLLLPAGVTSRASIMFKDEAELLKGESDIGEAYVRKVLPEKMKYNLTYIREFSCGEDLKVIGETIKTVFGS